MASTTTSRLSFLVVASALTVLTASCGGSRTSADTAPEDDRSGTGQGGGIPTPSQPGLDGSTPSTSGGPGGTAPSFESKLYILPERMFGIPDVGQAIDAALAARPAAQTVLVFVHGRSCGGGGEPSKSLAEVVPDLEKEHAAATLLFNWPGSNIGCPLGFPEKEAKDAGPALRYLIEKVQSYRSSDGKKNLNFVLLTHSMGNLVLEGALSAGPTKLTGVMDSLVLSSSATALDKHAEWLVNADFAANLYVTVNADDKVLLAASAGRGTRLGQKLDGAKLASGSHYVDFSSAGVNHQYFVRSGQKGPFMGSFFDAVLVGKPYDFASSTGVAKTDARDGAFIHTFR